MTALGTKKKSWVRLVGVYDADGGLFGEIAYVTGRLLGIAHCALCEISHTASGEKPAFRRTRRALGVPLEMLHRNEQPADMRALTLARTPCVVGQTAEGYEILMGRTDLEACRGDVACLEASLRERLELPD